MVAVGACWSGCKSAPPQRLSREIGGTLIEREKPMSNILQNKADSRPAVRGVSGFGFRV